MLKWLNLGLNLKLIQIIFSTGCSKEKKVRVQHNLFFFGYQV